MDQSKPPDGGYGWIIVIATILINISVLPLVQCFGIIFHNEFEKMHITATETSFLLHLHSAIYCSLGLLSSPLLKKFNYRRIAFLGTFLMCSGILLTSFAQSYMTLIFTVSVLIGIGQGILLPATYLATNSYFKKRLTLAVCFSVTGAGLSSIVMPQITTKLLIYFDREKTVLFLFIFSLVALISCWLLKPIKKNNESKTEIIIDILTSHTSSEPETDELINSTIYNETTLPVVTKKNILMKIYVLFNFELLKDRKYLISIIGLSISFASELNVILMIAFLLPELAKYEKKDVAFIMSILSIADIIGRLIIPLGANQCKIHPKIMYCSSLIVSSIGRTVLAILYTSKISIIVCAILFGLAKGTKAVYQSVIIPKLVCLEQLPAANGLNMLLTGTLSLIIGPLLGGVHDFFNSYVYALHAASIISMMCVVMWTFDYFIYRNFHLISNM